MDIRKTKNMKNVSFLRVVFGKIFVYDKYKYDFSI